MWEADIFAFEVDMFPKYPQVLDFKYTRLKRWRNANPFTHVDDVNVSTRCRTPQESRPGAPHHWKRSAGETEDHPKTTPVIMKKLRIPYAKTNETKNTLNELLTTLFQRWKGFSHPNVAGLRYAYIDSTTGLPAILVPYYPNGNIIQYLKNGTDSTPRLQLIKGALAGLSFLHDNGVVHGNLRGSNILVTFDGEAVLADPAVNTIIRGTRRYIPIPESVNWMPRELVVPTGTDDIIRPTTASDIYSFARTIQEIYTLENPFAHLKTSTPIQLVIKLERLWLTQPDKPNEVPLPVWILLQPCFAVRPQDRPTCAVLSREWDTLQ